MKHLTAFIDKNCTNQFLHLTELLHDLHIAYQSFGKAITEKRKQNMELFSMKGFRSTTSTHSLVSYRILLENFGFVE